MPFERFSIPEKTDDESRPKEHSEARNEIREAYDREGEAHAQIRLMIELFEHDKGSRVDIENDKQTLEVAEYWIQRGNSDAFRKFVTSKEFQKPPYDGDYEAITLDLVEKYRAAHPPSDSENHRLAA